MIKVIDYGLGNVAAFLTVFKRLGIEAGRASVAEDLESATKIILPGVGAFDHAIALLDESGMRPALQARVVDQGVPLLGVCVGMQMLADGSDEGVSAGLGWIPGRVRSFRSAEAAKRLPQPHMGWNDIEFYDDAGLFRGMADPRFYFLHSYYFECESQSSSIAMSDYGLRFSCAVRAGNVYGVQFHPEKSHHFGARLLKNFAEL